MKIRMPKEIKILFSNRQNLFLLTFLVTLPLYFILDANNQFWGLIPVEGSVKIFSLTIFFSIVVYFLFFLFVNALEKTIFVGASYLFWYLFFRTIQTKIAAINFLSFQINLGYFILTSICFLIVLTVVVFRQKSQVARNLANYVNLLFLVLCIVEVVKLGFNFSKSQVVKDAPSVKLSPVVNASKPDIYLLVMDEYAGIRSLEDKLGFNNQEFVNKLRQMGFFVSSSPNSNYNSTLFSISSLLNLNYSNSFIEKDLKNIAAFGKAAKEIQNNILVPFLQANSYSIKNYSGFRMPGIKQADAFYFMAIENRLALEKTFGAVLKNEILTRVPSNFLQRVTGTHIAKVDAYNIAVYDSLSCFLKRDAEAISPYFVYAHFFGPHEPFLYLKNGTPRNYADVFYDKRKGRYAKGYVEYLQYMNIRMEKIIREILTKEGDKIILLISDHGERFTEGALKGSAYNNFFAVYNTHLNYKGFSDTFPLINTFRVLLNNNFNQNLPMLNNKKMNVYTAKSELF